MVTERADHDHAAAAAEGSERSRWQRWLAASVPVIAVAGGAVALGPMRFGTLEPGFTVVVCGLLAAQLGWVRWHLAVADRNAGYQPLTAATITTLCRVGLLAVLGGFLVLEQPTGSTAWLPPALFAGVAVLDTVDGTLARARSSATRLGARLDVGVDSIAVFVGAALAVSYGTAPAFYLAVGLARPLFVLGIWVRKRRQRPVLPLDDSRIRRPAGALQVVVLCLALAPLLEPAQYRLLLSVAMVPLVASFVRDWLVVSGRW